MDFNFSLIFWILQNEGFLNGEEEAKNKNKCRSLVLALASWLCSLERNDKSSLVKKGYLGLVWLLILFDLFF